MPSISREVWIDASPEVVREHVADQDKRDAWVDGDLGAPKERDGGTADVLRFVRRDTAGDAEVEIVLEPAGAGTLVRVTETLTPAEEGTGATSEPTALARAA